LNYDLKWDLWQSFYPVDLYVRHASNAINAVLRLFLPLMEPTRSDHPAAVSQLSRPVGRGCAARLTACRVKPSHGGN
jgi:hypothetical protein